MPDPAAPSKPQRPPRRFWLWAPYAAVAVMAIVGGGAWFAEKTAVERGLDGAVQRLRAQGYDLSWQARRIDGFPFRVDLTLDQPRFTGSAGWAMAAPQLKAEAYAYDPGHWVLFAPQGLVVTRPGKGAVDMNGQAIRASVVGLPGRARLSFQGLKLTFKAEPGAVPPALLSADNLEFHLQPGPDDQAALLIRLDGGKANLPAVLGQAGPQAVGLMWDSRLSHLSQLSGPDWPSAVRHWTDGGGQMSVVQGGLTLGGATMAVQPATLTVGPDGRLSGVLPLTLHQGGAALGALGAVQALDPDAARTAAVVAQARQGADGAAAMALTFQAGMTTLGPINLGPAFKVY